MFDLFSHSLCTTLCLQWESPAIAIAFLYLAGKLSKYDLQAQAPCKTKSWWRQFLDTVDVHDLEGTYLLSSDLCIYVFHFLSRNKQSCFGVVWGQGHNSGRDIICAYYFTTSFVRILKNQICR